MRTLFFSLADGVASAEPKAIRPSCTPPALFVWVAKAIIFNFFSIFLAQ